MPKIPFTVSARTAKLIGQENFTNAQGAVVELVKNAYDADASNCIIIFENNTLYIIDNGTGMTEEVIQNEWMTIGTNNKQKSHTTDEGRVKTGAKGIGRFALDRLSAKTTIYTFPKENENSLIWKVTWDKFNQENISIHQVEANIKIINAHTLKTFLLKKFKKNKYLFNIFKEIKDKVLISGTIIKIDFLKDNWFYDEMKTLFKDLEILTPPIELSSDFKIRLLSSKYKDDFGYIENSEVDDYDYKLEASYNPKNNHTLTINITRDELNKEKVINEYSEIFQSKNMQKFPYTKEVFKQRTFTIEKDFYELKTFKEAEKSDIEKIGEFSFTFYFLKLNKSDDSESSLVKYPNKNFTATNRKIFLNKFGGIKIFRDNFRVRPYGENGDDWLNLGYRQAQSTAGAGQNIGAYRVKPNQILGTIEISRLTNLNFEDKSGREGIQENNIFDLFKNVIIEMISYFETDRNIIMNSLYNLHKNNNSMLNAIANAPKAADRILNKKSNDNTKNKEKSNFNKNNHNNRDEETLAKAALAYQLKLDEKDEEIRLLRNLASVGLIISSFSHEVHNLRTRLIPRNIHLKDTLKSLIRDEDISELNKYDNPFYMLEENYKEDIKLKHWLDYSLNSLKKDKRKRRIIDLADYFNAFVNNWSRALQQRKINITLEKEKVSTFKLSSFEVDLDVIFNNLLSNSMNAFKSIKHKDKKNITIEIKRKKEFIIIIFKDNGVGLDKIYKDNPEKIFNALETSRTDKHGNSIGTGLGLYLVKTTIDEYNHSDMNIKPTENGFSVEVIFKTIDKGKN